MVRNTPKHRQYCRQHRLPLQLPPRHCHKVTCCTLTAWRRSDSRTAAGKSPSAASTKPCSSIVTASSRGCRGPVWPQACVTNHVGFCFVHCHLDKQSSKQPQGRGANLLLG